MAGRRFCPAGWILEKTERCLALNYVIFRQHPDQLDICISTICIL